MRSSPRGLLRGAIFFTTARRVTQLALKSDLLCVASSATTIGNLMPRDLASAFFPELQNINRRAAAFQRAVGHMEIFPACP